MVRAVLTLFRWPLHLTHAVTCLVNWVSFRIRSVLNGVFFGLDAVRCATGIITGFLAGGFGASLGGGFVRIPVAGARLLVLVAEVCEARPTRISENEGLSKAGGRFISTWPLGDPVEIIP